jgi:hypothetical protein
MTNIPSAQGHDTPTSLVDFATTSTVQVEDLTQIRTRWIPGRTRLLQSDRDSTNRALDGGSRRDARDARPAYGLLRGQSDYAGFRAYSADRKLVPVSSEVQSVDPKRNTRVLGREFTRWTGSTI